MSLAGKVAIVTGGGRGIGAGISTRLAAEGARVVIAQRDPASAKATTDAIRQAGGEALVVETDVADPQSAAHLVAAAVERYDRLDVLVNNAGMAGTLGPFLDVDFDTWRRVIDTNLSGVFLCSQAAARVMVAHRIPGRVINIGSINTFVAQANASPYVASKGGVLALTRAMAVDLAPYGILVNCIEPGSIRVERNSSYFDQEPMQTMIQKGIPLGHAGSPSAIAGAVVFLASNDSGFITGASLTVDGGFTAFLRIE